MASRTPDPSATDAARLLRPGRWSLRTRLLVVLVSLLALVCLAVGLVTSVTLQHVLLGRLDAQLTSAGGRSSNAGGGDGDGSPPAGGGEPPYDHTGAGFLRAPGQAAGTLGARIAAGRVAAAILANDGELQTVPTAEAAALRTLPVDNRPHTREVRHRGDYRLLATQSPDGDVLITGLPLADLHATLYRLAAVEAAVAGLALIVAGVAGDAIVRRTLRPLRRVAATASQVSTLPLERGEVALAERVAAADTDQGTEVGQVGYALNRLLDHVSAALRARQASESRVRRFVADASHELRTPLAAIRGYAEVTRRTREAAPPDLAHAMARVESEAARMTALVEDLLLLARLDSGRPLEAAPVDLTRLVLDSVSDASAAGRDHQWRLNLPDEPVTVDGDGSRLHQVVANLLANARTHTPGGTTVTTTITIEEGAVVLEVSDNGPGIAATALPTVFERFARADSSRSRTTGSTGLGLAIVHAIVTAHHGSVDVVSQPGRTVFRVRLPAESGPQPEASRRSC